MEEVKGFTCSVRHLHSPLTFAFSWRTDKHSPQVVHAVTATCLQCKFLLQLQRWQAEEPRVVHVTTTTRIHFNWGGICRVDIPAAGCAFCDSDLRAVMHVSLALLICHDRWKGHHNYMQHIQSRWQRNAMGQLRWNLPSRHTGGGSRNSVTVTYRPLCMFFWLFGYATIVEKVTTNTCNTFNRYGSVAPRVSYNNSHFQGTPSNTS